MRRINPASRFTPSHNSEKPATASPMPNANAGPSSSGRQAADDPPCAAFCDRASRSYH